MAWKKLSLISLLALLFVSPPSLTFARSLSIQQRYIKCCETLERYADGENITEDEKKICHKIWNSLDDEESWTESQLSALLALCQEDPEME